MGEQRRQGKADPLAVVGIGASAGGLEACQTVFQRLPIDTGAAFVVVQHVDPLHSSALPELLGRCTRMPVVAAADGMRLERDRVYVIPPNVTLTVAEGVLRTEAPREPRGLRLPVDAFFHSLAKDFGWLAVAVVLSGTGADGSVGVRSVKEAGGIVFAQDPSTARYDGMPMSAVTTGIVDQVLPLERIPGALVHYLQHLRGVKPPNGEAADSEHLGPICAVVEEETGHDFSRYKPSTLLRRVRRRMRVLAIEMEADYLRHLRGDPAEAQALLRDFLIGVTQFFRDPAAFEGLAREVIEPLVAANARPTGQIRAWVPACSTGEEAFTVAMLLREACQRHTCPPQVTIFATDIDRHALDVARLGRYPESVAAQLTPERIERHFIQEDGVLQVSKAVREMCIFSLHNILTDPPFARLNLITCRNLFIFLEPELQRKLVPLFHYSLRAGGYLFLGPSETLVADEDLFRTVDKKLRIFQATEAPIRATPDMSLGRHLRAFRSEDLAFRQTPRRERDVRTTLERALLETHAPPGVVVDANNRVLYFTGKTGRYLQQPGGMPTAAIVEIVCPELRLELRTALHKARKTNAEVLQQGLQVTTDGQLQELDLVVRPLADDDDTRGMMLVVFRERGPVRPASAVAPRPASPDTEAVTRLEGELRAMREHLQSTVEELEGSNQEMRLSNEELLSLNEELQSTNEEMQTSKEELQSVNEELETVNTELRSKIEELDSASGDLQNFFQSTEIAMIFLDRELRIKRFTPATRALFRVVSTDVHRPITDFAPRFGDGNLVGDLQDVLRTLRMREHEVQLGEGDAWYLLRILPYKTVDNVIAGLVLTFFDITELKRAQEQRAQLAALVETSQDAILGASLDRTIVAWNQGAERTYGYTAAEMVGRSVDVLTPEAHREELARIPLVHLVHEQDREGFAAALSELGRGELDEYNAEIRLLRPDGAPMWVQAAIAPCRVAGEQVWLAGVFNDVSDRKLLQAQLEQARKLEGIGRLAGGIAHDFNNLLTAIVGYTDVTLRLVQDPRAQANLEQVRVACKRATDLTARLLAFARKQVIEPRVIDVNEMATRTEQLLRRLIEPNIEVRLELAPEALNVRVDPGQLEEAVLNLALNARDAMPSGGTLTLAVARREIASGGGPRLPLELADGSYVTLRMSDTGVGMSADEMQRCFEPFYTTKELGKGTGLGLATVYGVVRQAGGHIATESRPGQGTSFTLYLPLAGEDAVAPPQELVPVGGEPGGSETILVVEDEPILLDLAASALADYGYTVLEARDGQQALRLLEDRAGAVDAVITDVLMPKMGGRELAEAVRARWPDLPVLFVSGYSEGAIGDGVFLEKPYTPNELERKLRAMLDTARARRTAPA